MKWKRIRKPICERLQPPGVEDVVKSNDSSQQMTTRHTGCRFAKHLENIPKVSVKGGCRYCRIEKLITTNDDPSYRMSICKTLRKYSASVCEGGGGLKMLSNRTTDGFSDLRYHNVTQPRIDFRFDDSSTAFDDSQRFGCIGQPS